MIVINDLIRLRKQALLFHALKKERNSLGWASGRYLVILSKTSKQFVEGIINCQPPLVLVAEFDRQALICAKTGARLLTETEE